MRSTVFPVETDLPIGRFGPSSEYEVREIEPESRDLYHVMFLTANLHQLQVLTHFYKFGVYSKIHVASSHGNLSRRMGKRDQVTSHGWMTARSLPI